uniref:Putative secreted protein n=1 Tax=Anopheles marajoara TaxID=58244 RepID=A0A2M4CA40_9DIPT
MVRANIVATLLVYPKYLKILLTPFDSVLARFPENYRKFVITYGSLHFRKKTRTQTRQHRVVRNTRERILDARIHNKNAILLYPWAGVP